MLYLYIGLIVGFIYMIVGIAVLLHTGFDTGDWEDQLASCGLGTLIGAFCGALWPATVIVGLAYLGVSGCRWVAKTTVDKKKNMVIN